jgi:hypothetical protein
MDSEEKHFKKVQAFQAVIIIIAILGITANFWGFKIYAFGWHFINPNPFVWENIKISVPADLVVKDVKNNKKRKIISLINFEPKSQVAIYFAKLNNPSEGDPLKAIYQKMKFEFVEEKPCQILGQPCQWVIGKYKESEEEKYREDIFLNSHNVYISYQGSKDKRFYLDQIASSLQ